MPSKFKQKSLFVYRITFRKFKFYIVPSKQAQVSEITVLSFLQSILKVKLYAKHIGKSTEEIEADIRRPKYFSPSEAVEYGIIDKVPELQSKLIIIFYCECALN